MQHKMQTEAYTVPDLYIIEHDSKSAIKELYIKKTDLKGTNGNTATPPKKRKVSY